MFTKNHSLLVVHFVLVLVLILGMLGLEPIQPVFASTLMVTNTNDSGAGSLRKAIADAVNGDTITFALSLSGQTIVLSSTLVIDKNVTIDGSLLAIPITIDGTDNVRVFMVDVGVSAALNSLIIKRGYSYGDGAAIYNEGTLVLTNDVLLNNSADGSGGGIFNVGTLTIMDSTLSGNTGIWGGGGILNGGNLTVTNSTLSSNSVPSDDGGGITIVAGTVTVTNSIFSQNIGGAIYGEYQNGTITITNSLFDQNTGGGVHNPNQGTLMVTETIFSANTGSAIRNTGTTTIVSSVFIDNSNEYFGGAVYNNGLMTITDSSFFGNSTATWDGGAIDNVGGKLTIANSAFAGNSAAYAGGAISNTSDLTITNSTFYSNSASNAGGGISNSGPVSTLTLTNSTISGNSALRGGGIVSSSGTLNYANTIIANSPFGDDCSIDFSSTIGTNTNNLIEDGSCLASMSGDPKLASLADNGGPTPTMVLLSDSPAIDAGEDTSCPATDQRGVTRPQGAACDIGAFEAEYTLVDVTIGNSDLGSHRLVAHGSRRQSFAGVNNGPVKVQHLENSPIIAAERVIYNVKGVNTSFTEMMGLPDSELDNIYWLPWYNNVDLDTQLRFANVSNSTATVHVYIGGEEMQNSPFTLQVGESTRKSFAGINDGPVQIWSDQNIVAAERVIYRVNGVNTSFSEMMGLPARHLYATYWLPWYNNVDLDTQLRIANATTNPATVQVTIGGMAMEPINLAAGESTRVSYPGINNGPVRIESDQNIVVAERVIYKVNGKNTSFTEMMALPNNQLETTYWLPWYNNVDLDTQLRFANTTTSTATVHIYIGGVEVDGSPFTLAAGASTRKSFVGINAGPVQIVSDQDIVAAERVIYKAAGGVNTSFSEMMALPNTLLHTTYWFPWYNNVDLDTQLRFGVP